MALSREDIQKSLRIKRAVDEYFNANQDVKKIQAKELMPQFLAKGIFTHNNKDGFPIREFLRRLDDEKQLKLIPQTYFEEKDKNKNWFFLRNNN